MAIPLSFASTTALGFLPSCPVVRLFSAKDCARVRTANNVLDEYCSARIPTV